MEPAYVTAIISAGAGIVGVLSGNIFVLIKETLVKADKVKKDTAYLGVIVVSHLERFASGCLEVALDDGTQYGRPAGDRGEHEAVVVPPEFSPLNINVEWGLLPTDLLYAILRLPDQQDQLQGILAGIKESQADHPEHTEYFWLRMREFAVLGLRASCLAKKLRKHAALPDDESDDNEWSRDKVLERVIAGIDSKRFAYESQMRNP
ncbi:hypothetical protein AOA59_29485 [Pseudomonas sp. 2822-15]|uniref:hypothetical protein n=1 Tax=Pseudomonas sp. 2822-15 TaxID=1712677 RepID=UPI000C149F49|nr:hypothetical protein [Pseudomonas sp. 2822-15]PIB40622.1 hypothetical protein AOA59_29485 [Pseudomonas sp. 2822-15]